MTYTLHIIIMISVMIFPTLGYNLVFGRGKILFFGQVVFSLLSTYGMYIGVYRFGGYGFHMLIAPLLVCATAVLFAWLATRLTPDAFGILSLAMHLSLLAIVLNWTSLTRGALGIPHIPRFPFLESQEAFCITVFLTAVAWFFVIRCIDAGRLGRQLIAFGEHQHHAEALGMHRFSVYLQTFLLAGCGSLLSGFFYPQYIGLLHPSDYAFQALIPFMVASIIGGSGSVILTALALVGTILLTEGLRFLPLSPGLVGPLRLILFGVILLVAVYIRRNEIFPKRRAV